MADANDQLPPMRSLLLRFNVPPSGDRVIDDDFGWDALIHVSGDWSDADRRRYVEAVSAVLNENEARIPIAPPEEA